MTYAYDAVGRKTSETDPLSNVTAFEYDLRDRLVEVTAPDPDGGGSAAAPVTQYDYDDAGRLTSETDPAGKVTSYTYDANGQVLSVTQPDPDGGGSLTAPVTEYAYDNLGRLILVTDPLDFETEYEYDVMDRLVTVVDALANETTYTFDDAGRTLTVTAPDPDGAGSLVSGVTTYAYDDLGRLTSVTDALSNVTSFEYDNLGRLIETTLADPDAGGSLTAPVTTTAYDVMGRTTRVTDPLSHYVDYAYDDAGQLVSVTLADPDGGGALSSPVLEYEYDLLGRLVTEIDPLDQEVSYAYDAAGRVTAVTDELGNVTTTAYDNLGRVTSVTASDPDGVGSLTSAVTTYAYDVTSRLTTLTQADPDQGGSLTSPVTTYAYDNIGRLLTVTDPLSHTTTYAYDAAGNRTKVTDGLGKFTQYAFDALGRLTTLTQADPDGAGGLSAPETEYAYDNLGRLVLQTDPNAGETSFTYDAVGNLLSLTDPEQNTTSYDFDNLYRLIEETNENDDAKSYVYDAASRLTGKTDRNERVTEFVYDNLNRLTSELWKDGSTTIRTLSYVYDAAGKMTSAEDDDSAYAYTYNAAGWVTEVDNDGTPDLPHVVLANAYDNLGRRSTLSAEVEETDDFINSYIYDALSRMTQVTQTDQQGGNPVADKRVDLAYNAAGAFSTITRYNDLSATLLVASTTFGYDNANRLTSLTHAQNSTTLAAYAWTYDAIGRLTATTNPDGSSSFTYDATSQLTDADHSYQTDEAYEYDANGNRINDDYAVGANNRLTTDGTFDYEYDDEGNRTKKTTIATDDYVTYTWDHHNRLTAVAFYDDANVMQKKIVYTYDVFDRLIYKEVDDDGDATYDRATGFVHDGDDTILAFDETGSLTNRYLSGALIDQVFADEDAVGEILWGLSDNQGTVRDVAKRNTGTGVTSVVNHVKYDAYGNITAESDSSKTPLFAYTGRVWDEDANLYYYRARWYDPVVGRFISEDPLGFDGGDFNLQRYVGNVPLTRTDPTGLSWLDGYGNWMNNLTGGGYAAVGNAIYGGAIAAGMSNNTIANMSDGTLVVGTTVVSAVTVLGGEYILGGTVASGIAAGISSAVSSSTAAIYAWWASLGQTTLTIGGGGGLALAGGGTLGGTITVTGQQIVAGTLVANLALLYMTNPPGQGPGSGGGSGGGLFNFHKRKTLESQIQELQNQIVEQERKIESIRNQVTGYGQNRIDKSEAVLIEMGTNLARLTAELSALP